LNSFLSVYLYPIIPVFMDFSYLVNRFVHRSRTKWHHFWHQECYNQDTDTSRYYSPIEKPSDRSQRVFLLEILICTAV